MTAHASGRLSREGKLKFPCPKCRRRVTTRLAAAGTTSSCPACRAPVRVPELITPDLVHAARWYCYEAEGDARTAFRRLKRGPLGGPGFIELRRDTQSVTPWWVVLYDLLCGPATDMERVYRMPRPQGTSSWSAYQLSDKLPCRSPRSEIIELVGVRASRTDLQRASAGLGDAFYTGSPDVTCREEAERRLRSSLYSSTITARQLPTR